MSATPRPETGAPAPSPVMTPQEIVHELDKYIVGQTEAKLEKHQGNLLRSAVELAKDWRTDRMLRRLEAMLAIADRQTSLVISGNGDVLEPEHGLLAIGSGGGYAQAAALALLDNTQLEPAEIVQRALSIAGDLCIYTNQNHVIETL